MKLDNRAKYIVNMMIVVLVYTVLFELFLLWGEDFSEQQADIKNMLSVIAGFPVNEMVLVFAGDKARVLKWIMGVTVLFILTGREVYEKQNDLKYMALLRYGSYRKFYSVLMNRTVYSAFLYGSMGVLITYVLYFLQGNAQVSNLQFLKMGAVYLTHILMLCLLQTLCMILTQGYMVNVLLLLTWFIIILSGQRILGDAGWIWMPPNWGMYLRSTDLTPKGVQDIAYIMQFGSCILIWAGTPVILSKIR